VPVIGALVRVTNGRPRAGDEERDLLLLPRVLKRLGNHAKAPGKVGREPVAVLQHAFQVLHYHNVGQVVEVVQLPEHLPQGPQRLAVPKLMKEENQESLLPWHMGGNNNKILQPATEFERNFGIKGTQNSTFLLL
jgi:hypothetical protein